MLVPSAHAVSATMDNIDLTWTINITFLFSVLLASGLVLPRARLPNRKITRTTKATETSSQPGIEPGPSTPSLNR